MLSGYSKELQILSHANAKRDCSNAFSFRDVTFFDFFETTFEKNLSTKKFKKFEITNLMKIQPFVSVQPGVSNLAS